MSANKNFTRWSVAGAALCAGLVASTSAFAGAFAVREQSSYYQGMSFAGSAAGDDLSSMFWNSAAAAAAPGINVAAHSALVVPQTEIEATDGSFIDPAPTPPPVPNFQVGLDSDSGKIGGPTFVPASYANYQVNERLFLGVALNGQYGFTTKPDNLNFAGTPIQTTSKIFSLNINPNIAYKITPDLTVGVGLQALYADVRLRSSNSGFLSSNQFDGREVEVDDWAFGATAGVIWNPAPGTRIGVGYRSAIEVNAEGTCSGRGLSSLAPPATGVGCGAGVGVEAELTLPDLVTASFSQQIGERWKVLGTVEWTNWSRVPDAAQFKTTETFNPVGGAPAEPAGTTVDVFPQAQLALRQRD